MTMAEYVAVPDTLLAKTTELKAFFDASYRHVASLKPKPTMRTKQVKTVKKTSAKAAKSATSTKRPKR